MDLKCGYAVSGGVMGGALFGMIVGALVVNASIGYILLLLIAWGLALWMTVRTIKNCCTRTRMPLTVRKNYRPCTGRATTGVMMKPWKPWLTPGPRVCGPRRKSKKVPDITTPLRADARTLMQPPSRARVPSPGKCRGRKECNFMARKKVTSALALADWSAVDSALRDIRECQHTLAEMSVQRDRQIDSIKADYTQAALPLQNRMKALESDVKAYVDMHRAELDGKSRTLTFGTVGYRVSSKLMLASGRVAEAIATLKALGHAELVKTTETLDREALRRQPGELLQQVGAYIRTVDEFYYDVSTKEADA